MSRLAIVCGFASLAAAAATDGTNRWCFQPIRQITPPKPGRPAWANNPIDAFILAKLDENHLAPAPPAERVILLRRAYFDLIGLPPSPEELDTFAKDTSPDAWPKTIDRLLASPHYGERWARHWLDLVRYADTGGFEHDLLYPKAWRYRDYAIRAFNEDKPLDRFLQEQVAGDELWPDNAEAIVATGLYAVGPAAQDSALNSTQLEYEWLTDSVDTTSAAFMGLTLGCARCHDHKYDPLTQRDYFAMQAIFAASDRPYPNGIRDNRIKGLNAILADVPIPKELLDDPRCTIKTDNKLDLRLFHRDTPMEVHRLQRGELSKPRETVEPALPAVFLADKKGFNPAAASATQRRAVFAKWLVSRENPLTARVMVNRVWTWHFGQGIVRTPNDFGAQGEPPSHSELLDWLARDFIDHGWDLKRLHRQILLSSTYQMASAVRARKPARLRDPNNRLLSHFNRRRLEAEAIWDSIHCAAGTLNLKQFGPPVVPSLTKDELSGLFGADKWKVTEDPAEGCRRGIYMLERRTFLFPVFDAFDPPDVMASCPRRFETTVPTQALALLNSEVAQSQAREFARRLLRDCGGRVEKTPARAWLLAFNRPITKAESRHAGSFLRARQSASPEDRLAALCLALFNANEFVFVD